MFSQISIQLQNVEIQHEILLCNFELSKLIHDQFYFHWDNTPGQKNLVFQSDVHFKTQFQNLGNNIKLYKIAFQFMFVWKKATQTIQTMWAFQMNTLYIQYTTICPKLETFRNFFMPTPMSYCSSRKLT